MFLLDSRVLFLGGGLWESNEIYLVRMIVLWVIVCKFFCYLRIVGNKMENCVIIDSYVFKEFRKGI